MKKLIENILHVEKLSLNSPTNSSVRRWRQPNLNATILMRFLAYLAEIFGWIRIFMTPFLIGLIIVMIIYFSKPDTLGLVIGILFILAGFIFGVCWAKRIQKTKGTMNFLSKIDGSSTKFDNNKTDKE